MDKDTADIKARRLAAAERARAEAQQRRARHDEPARPSETGGQAGPEPTRYGDWEKEGIISDF